MIGEKCQFEERKVLVWGDLVTGVSRSTTNVEFLHTKFGKYFIQMQSNIGDTKTVLSQHFEMW